MAAGFAELLQGFDLDEIERHQGVVFGLWPDFTLAYFNPAWFRFAAENAGEPAISRDWPLGRPILAAISADLRTYYQELYAALFTHADTARTHLQHEYECSSAERFRRLQMTVYPLIERRGLLIVNSVVVDGPHDPSERVAYEPDLAIYLDALGVVHQCSHCRRVQHQREPDRWDWVPQWVRERPPDVSHGLCGICLDFYFPIGS